MSCYEYPYCLIFCLDINFITHRSLTFRSLCSTILPPLMTHPDNMTFSFIKKHVARSWPGCWNFLAILSVPICQNIWTIEILWNPKALESLKRFQSILWIFYDVQCLPFTCIIVQKNAMLCNMQDSSGNKMCLHWVGVHCLVFMSFNNPFWPSYKEFLGKNPSVNLTHCCIQTYSLVKQHIATFTFICLCVPY